MTPESPQDPLDRLIEHSRAVELEPPPGFVAVVMRRVHALQDTMPIWRRLRRRIRATNLLVSARVNPMEEQMVPDNRPSLATSGGLIMKKVVWGVAVLGAVAIVSFVWLGYPPAEQGTEGTIGAAQRYKATPATTPGQALGDMGVQEFLQSDTFDRLMKNKDTRELLQKAASDPAFARAFADPAFLDALARPAVRSALADASVRQALANADARAALAEAAKKALADPAAKKAIAGADAKKAVASADAKTALASADAKKALASADAKKFLAEPSIIAVLAEPAFQDVLARPSFMKALAEPAMQEALGRANLWAALSEPAMAKALAAPAFAKALSDPALGAALRADAKK